MLLWFSEGVDVGCRNERARNRGPDNGARRVRSRRAHDRALEAMSIATRSDLIVYGIDPRGLRGSGSGTGAGRQHRERPNAGPGTATLRQETLRDQTTLRTVSGYTGGFAVVNTSQIRDGVRPDLEENSSYYMLGH